MPEAELTTQLRRVGLNCKARASVRPSSTSGLEPWGEAALPHLREVELAQWREELGGRVVERRGRFWLQVSRGFFKPVSPFAPLRASEVGPPTRLSWGFQACLASEEAHAANATLPVHLYPDLARYGLERMGGERRRKLRRAMAEIDLAVVREPDILFDEGYAVACEANACSPGNPLAPEPAYRRWIVSHLPHRRGLVLAGLRHGRLLGFCTNWAAGGVAYQDVLYVGEEGRRRGLAACLFHATATLAARAPAVTTLANGLHLREQPGVTAFKASLGLELRALPARVWFAPMTEPLVRHLRPNAHYRLRGQPDLGQDCP